MPDKVKNNYFGMNLVWFFGVVEDRNDPIKLGRVRVRCHTWHTEDKTLLPTEALPWAQCIQPITSAATSGIGRSPTGLVEGSWVFGFFMDGQDAQKPMIMGSLAGIPTESPNKEKGFNDPNEVFPSLINEPDVDRLARNDLTPLESPLLATKAAGLTTGSLLPHGQGTWNEEGSKYNAKYANNHVTRTESGHVFEIDDTPGHERIHEYHKSGTFKEITASGNTVTRIVGDNYTIVLKDNYVRIKGKTNVHIDGDCNMYIGGNWNVQAKGNIDIRGARIDLNKE